MSASKVNISFELDPQEWHGGGVETLWATRLDDSPLGTVFRLENSPFYARGISYRDIVRALPRKGSGEYVFAGVIERSGHSTYMILILDGSPRFHEFWEKLKALGYTYEITGVKKTSYGLQDLYSVDVPPEADVHKAF